MAIPFIPFHLPGIWQVFQLLGSLNNVSETGLSAIGKFDPSMSQVSSTGWVNDFTISVSKDTPNFLGFLLCSIWIVGMFATVILVLRSRERLSRLKNSSLPLQNLVVHNLFEECKTTLHITRDIPIYSTAFLKSPITVGVLHPQIYLPIHLISDYKEKDMRYILLHELQHYRYKDAIPNYLMNLAGVLYWFNPAIWYAFKAMKLDREVACDSAVLQSLTENDYEAYGTTLINFAEKVYLSPFPFASGLSGSMSQIKKRILNIAFYKSPTQRQKILGICVYGLIAAILIGFAPLLSTYAAEQEYYHFQENNTDISYLDLSSYFQGYNGCFVLYNDSTNTWQIYNKVMATTRVSPNSTYKIYEGLMGLEYGIILPKQTGISWDGTNQPFSSWNTDQDLISAMHNSVNWYFEKIEQSIGSKKVQNYLNKIAYGNENISGGNSYWMESSLKISPIEQIELLKKFNTNQLSSNVDNTNSIKKSILLSSSPEQSVYGKTGTGRVNGQDINGWFIGYIEKNNQVYYFAINIQNTQNATGGKAEEISQSILSDLPL